MTRKNLWLVSRYKIITFITISLAAVIFVNFFNLSGATNHRLSHPEIASIQSATSGTLILNNPLFLPYKLATYVVIKLGIASVFSLRAISAAFGVILICLFYSLMRLWFSPRISWIASFMLTTSSLFLGYSRLAMPDILLPLGLLGLLWSAWWLFQKKQTNTMLIIVALTLTTSLYIPGLIWFVILVSFVQRRYITALFKKISPSFTALAAIIAALLLLPLIRALIINPELIREFLALPINFIPQDFILSAAQIPAALIVRAPADPVHNLGRLAYLDVLTICLIVLGTYNFVIRPKLVRTRALIGAFIIGWVLIAAKNSVSIILILPLIYIVVASGLVFLLQRWYNIFPSNPIARTFGLIILSCAISLSLYYNTVRYLVAWTHNPVSQQSFTEKVPQHLL